MGKAIVAILVGAFLATNAHSQQLQPSCLVVANSPSHKLFVGQRDGTLAELDVASHSFVRRQRVAKSIVDLAVTPWGVLVLDSAGKQLLHVEAQAVRKLSDVPAGAVRLCYDDSRRAVLITSKWSRELMVLRLNDQGEVRSRVALSLPFAPQELVQLPSTTTSQWLLADAFGGRLAVVDVSQQRLMQLHRLHAHNIRGLARSVDGKQILVAHQQIDPRKAADYEELHWGRLITNDVQTIEVSALANNSDAPLAGWRNSHGGIGGATGDPSALLVQDGVVVTAFSGVGEVCVEHRGRAKRVAVGRGPSAVAMAGDQIFVANRFEDSLSVIDLNKLVVTNTISLSDGNDAQPVSAIQRGERLFYDATLSHQGWMSCHSCHTDGHSNGLLIDTLGDGDYGAPKRVPSLLAVKGTGPWGWVGGSSTLESQIHKSVLTTMHGDTPLTTQQVDDIVAYLQSLRVPEPLPCDELARQGEAVFRKRCASCHAAPRYTNNKLYDVGTSDQHGRRRFNPPSLLGVRHRPRLLHDGAANSLEDLLLNHRHPNQDENELSTADLQSLLAFLKTL